MSEPSSSSKKMFASLNKIDPVSFSTPLSTVSPSKMSTTSQVNIALDSPRNPLSPLDINKPILSSQHGHHSDMLSDHLFEGDLPESRTSESNILAASESLVIESLNLMREGALLEGNEISISKKGKEKVVEVEFKRRPFTSSESKKLMVDAMKANAASTTDNRKKRTLKVSRFQIPLSDVVEVSGAKSEEEPAREVSDILKERSNKKGHRGKNKGTSQSSVSKKTCGTMDKGKRKRATPEIEPEMSEQRHDDTKKQKIIGNLRRMNVYLDEDLLGNILEVPRDGIGFVVGRTCSVEFVKECSKIPTTRRAGLLKKLMKGEEEDFCHFPDLFLMESLCKLEPLDLPAPIIEHIGNDLESEQQGCLDCYLIKAELLKAQTEGPGISEVQELHRENAEMRTKIGALQEKAIKDNDEANARLTLIIQSLSHQSPSS
ncbi:hypothetical protein EJD97_003221 [Solanum chilense]|uniref:Uncharacterized protein n=1 Tax=Solanum chilense TaxID=4083 RepID=A0A6N2BYL7_SOLCI|nr:hypothetical protein EJD97_003221 [Solanum chilense]